MKEHAVPFALGALLGVLGVCSALIVRRVADGVAKEAGMDANAVKMFCVWAIDAAQVFVCTAAPAVAWLGLLKRASSGLAVAYVGVFAAGLALFVVVLLKSPADYNKWNRRGMTPVPALGIAINAVLLAIVQFSG